MPARPQVLELKNVWYRYPEAEDFALKGIDLSIKRGEAIGIVGPSGGGKSTLVDVILGILKPERGAVLADGVDVRTQLARWHRLVGYVPQSVYLFDGTIRQNIALGLNDDAVDPDALTNALRAANLESFVNGLPQGLDTVVGERGVRFSGGQRQRVAIARALYDDPALLVMDEATSALDNLTEKAVMEAVDDLKGERTILMIAHRLTTLKNCDRILFLQTGEITAIGSHDQLAGSDEVFERIAHAR
jgi:ATP-binding cassette subfamily C protein